MTYFVAARSADSPYAERTPRIGLTVGKVMGKAVDRNRIKRRMREAVRRNIATLEGPIDVVLHPRRSVIDLDFAALDREVAQVFRNIQKAAKTSQ
jgi:ribonuclease P protein component